MNKQFKIVTLVLLLAAIVGVAAYGAMHTAHPKTVPSAAAQATPTPSAATVLILSGVDGKSALDLLKSKDPSAGVTGTGANAYVTRIEGYTARINQQRAGCPVNVFVNITLDRQDEVDLRKFEEAVRKIPEVMECYLMTGDYDYTLRVVVADTADYERIHSKNLTRLPGVARIHSSFALRTVQKSKELPIR